MTTDAIPFAELLSPEIEADARAVIDSLATGRPLDPEVGRRVRARSRKIREESFRRHGLLDIGVPAIRELRGELPEA